MADGLAIFAGRGALPRLVAEDCARRGRPYRVVVFEGVALDWLAGHPVVAAAFERPGRLFAALRAAGCGAVTFAGGIVRPKLRPLRFDLTMWRLAPGLLRAVRGGDDATLRAVAGIFEAAGFRVEAPQELLPELPAAAGVLSRALPSDRDRADAARAAGIVAALGAADVGQAAVVAQGVCLGLESIQGTDALLDFVARTGAAFRPDPGRCEGGAVQGAEAGAGPPCRPAGDRTRHAARRRRGRPRRRGRRGGRRDDPRPCGDRGRGGRRRPVPLGARAMTAARGSGTGPRLFLVAGEPSGDRLGGALIEGFRSLGIEPELQGVGGPSMAAAGMASRFPMEELSVMGIAEVLPRLPNLLRRIAETAEAVVAMRPGRAGDDRQPGLLAPGGAGGAQALPGLRSIHYVAPSVWAWRPGRAAKMAEVVDHVLALLPFEPPYMEAAGMTCDFVGHPVAAEPQADPDAVAALRAELAIAPGQPVLALLPGSRRGEVTRLAPVFAAVAKRLRARLPDLAVVVPAAPAVVGLLDERLRPDDSGWPHVLDPRALRRSRLGGAQARGLRGGRRGARGLGHGQPRARGGRDADGDRL